MYVNYYQYLKTGAWRERRAEVIARAKGICERCRRWSIVNVHHLTYERLGREYPDDLLGVCSRCHEELHGGR